MRGYYGIDGAKKDEGYGIVGIESREREKGKRFESISVLLGLLRHKRSKDKI